MWAFNYIAKADNHTHEQELNNRLLWPFGWKPKAVILKAPPIEREMPRFDVLIVPHCGGNPAKDWYEYTELISSLRCRVAIIGNKSEREYCHRYWAYNLCGKYTLAEMCHILKNAKVVVGNDSGLVKLADALGVPTIQIFRRGGDIQRASTSGTNLIEPKQSEVLDALHHYCNP